MAIDRDKVLQAAQKFVEKEEADDKAVAEYQKLVAEDPNDARTLLKIGDLQSKMEAFPDAIGTYERVGKFYASQGFALKAIAVYKQIRELIAKHAPQLEERYGHITPKLAELYQQLGLTSDALAALDEVATRLQRQDKDQEAIDVFRKIVELDPTNPLPHLRLAEALSRVKDTEAAVAEFGLAASQLVRLGRRDDALKVIERLLHHRPDPAHARIAAELYLARNQQNDGMQALSKLQICFQANPKDLDTLALLARAFAAIGQAAKGIEVQKEMAKIAREQGKTELFKQLVEKLQRAAPNDEGVRALIATVHADARPARAPAPSYPEPAPASVPIDDLEYEGKVVETGDIQESDLDAEPIPRCAATGRRRGNRCVKSARHDVGSARPGVDDSSSPELIVGDDQLVAEDFPSGEVQQADIGEQLAQILSDAASFRRVRLYPEGGGDAGASGWRSSRARSTCARCCATCCSKRGTSRTRCWRCSTSRRSTSTRSTGTPRRAASKTCWPTTRRTSARGRCSTSSATRSSTSRRSSRRSTRRAIRCRSPRRRPCRTASAGSMARRYDRAAPVLRPRRAPPSARTPVHARGSIAPHVAGLDAPQHQDDPCAAERGRLADIDDPFERRAEPLPGASRSSPARRARRRSTSPDRIDLAKVGTSPSPTTPVLGSDSVVAPAGRLRLSARHETPKR